MKQFFVQYFKDFKSNFYNYNAYIILGGYCLLSFFSTLYLGDYFLRESNVLNAYFSIQPIILMLIIPAVTMRSWADEIKSGTIEMLLTLPISYTKLVIAKFMAALTFFVLMISCSLPFLFITNNFFILDINSIYLSYSGLFLCGALFTAIGCLISSFNRNIILSYISTIFIIFFITQFEIGNINFNNINISLRCFVFEDNYNAFLTGVICWRNICYFVLFTALLLWLNTVTIQYKKPDIFLHKKQYCLFSILLCLFFSFTILGTDLNFNVFHDMTDEHKFTLSSYSQDILSKLNKRIDITLYESKNKREDANSSYATYACYVEQFFKLIEHASKGLVRTNFVRIEPFSAQERNILRDNVPFTDDNLGYKVYMVAEFSDNEGNHSSINSFKNLRQDLLESDIMRVIQRFSLKKKNIAVFASTDDLIQMSAFSSLLNEFYNVSYFDTLPNFIDPKYDAVIYINPILLSSDTLLALDQYVLGGGNLVIFSDPLHSNRHDIKTLSKFVQSFGFQLDDSKDTLDENTHHIEAATLEPSEFWDNIRSVIIDGAGTFDFISSSQYKTFPILYSNNNLIAAVSIGKFVSNYLDLVKESENMQAMSKTDSKVLFFYDSDLLKDYLYVSEESHSHDFYEIIPVSDNMLFFLNLLDFVTGEYIEKTLSYRHFALNRSSIGGSILSSIKSRYADKMQLAQKELDKYLSQQNAIKGIITGQGYASAKNFESIGTIAHNIDEKNDEIHHLKALILHDYQSVIITVSVLIIFIVPAILLLLLALFLHIIKKVHLKKIRRFINDASSY